MLALLLLISNLFIVDFGNNAVYADEPDPDSEEFDGEDLTLSPDDRNAEIDLQAASSSLTVGSPTLSGSTEPGGIAYAKSNVTYSVVDTTSWALQVSYASGSSALAYVGSGGTAIGGAGNNVALTDNKWGYSWTDDKDAGQPATYRTMPNYGSPATMKSGTTNASTTGAIHFATKFGSNAVPGHYKTDVLLSLVSTAESVTYYQITYDANGGVGVPPNTSIQASGSNATLAVTNLAPTRSGYVLLGWGNTPNDTSASYQPGAFITLQSTSPNKTLYAIWRAASLKDITTMQEMTTAVCATSTDDDAAALTDTRDNSIYTIKKVDNQCWMTQNLRIVNKTITPADSDVSVNYTIPASTSPWSDTAANTNKVYYAGNTTYGAYYTWYTATAGTGIATMTSGDVKSSICPKNWRLPTNTEYEAILNSTAISKYNFLLDGGRVESGVYTNEGHSDNSYYWSSTALYAYSTYSAYCFSYRGSDSVNTFNRRYAGQSVRCVAR